MGVKGIFLIIIFLIPCIGFLRPLLKGILSAVEQGSVQPILVIRNTIDFKELLTEGVFVVAAIFFASIVAKWLDIKKYQETWARHADHKYKLDKEIFLFVQSMQPYDTPKRKEVFIHNIWEIWDANNSKFVSNLEGKEKELTDIYAYIRKK